MTNPWDAKGCEHCRDVWRKAQRLPELAVDFDEHTSLHQCPECGTYWEMHERFVDVLSLGDAKTKYPHAFDRTSA
jgi:hypothetical protein